MAIDLSEVHVTNPVLQQQRLAILRRLALLHIDLSQPNPAESAQVDEFLLEAKTLLASAPKQRLVLTLVEFRPSASSSSAPSPAAPSPAALAVVMRLREALAQVTLQLRVVTDDVKKSHLLAASQMSLKPM
jgi:hypothetical protein